MLTPKQLQDYENQLSSFAYEMENEFIFSATEFATKELKKDYDVLALTTATAIFINQFEKKKAIMIESLKKSVAKTVYDAAEQNYIFDKQIYTYKKATFISFAENKAAQKITKLTINKVNIDMSNLARTMAFGGKPFRAEYLKLINTQALQISQGTINYIQAIKNTVKTLSEKGITAIPYPSGRKFNIVSAVRMNVMDSIKTVTHNQSIANAKALKITTFEFSWHGAFRPSHSWGGRRFDTTGKDYPTMERVCEQYGGGNPSDANCKHSFSPITAEMPPTWTDEDLKRLEAQELVKHKYKDKEYTNCEASQEQRKMEHSMRKTRQMGKAFEKSGDTELAKVQQSIYKQQRKQYKAFSDGTGQFTDYERVYLDGLGRF